ncbi:hypothetical protein BGW39_009231 [Mortierella sp. 14UC]|nr:hypothetical protein BGW39_009231 [Mortierella sp. 14UC]
MAKRDFVTSTRTFQSKLFSVARPSSARTPSSSSSIPRSATPASNSLPSSLPSVSPPNNLTTTTLAQVAKYSDPIVVARMGRKRRHLAAMHRARLQRQLKLMQRSQPRHSSQLLGLNGLPSGFSSRGGRFKGTTRKIRRRVGMRKPKRWYGTRPSQYHHIHYYGTGPRHFRFLDIKDFLRHSRITSSPGQSATERRIDNIAVKQKQDVKRRSQYHSIRRPFVLEHRHRLVHMNQVLEEGPKRLAMIDAILLIRGKKAGAKLPSGHDFYKVVKLDEAYYYQLQAAKTTPVDSRLPSGAPPPAEPRHFATQDFNIILERCEELRDWKSGLLISHVLLKRYQSPGFDFHSSDFGAPNARTIHLMAKMFVRWTRPDLAGQLFSTLHTQYPHRIPLDVYTSYLTELGAVEEFDEIESTLRYLKTVGPHPTVTQYNTVLKAIGHHKGRSQAEVFMEQMVKAGTTPDQQSYRILIELSLGDLDLAGAHNWLGEYTRQGFEVYPRMMEPFMSTCIHQVCRRGHKRLGTDGTDNATLAQEWMLKAMNILQFMSRQELSPTSKTFEMLIKGFLAQENVPGARRVLNLMRSSPYFYTPNPRTWIKLFEYHLRQDEPLSALRTLNEMRLSGAGLKPGEIPLGTVVPTKLYRKLFQYYLSNDKLSMAERSLYEMLIRHKGARPNEQDILDLIWKLDQLPEAAERVYELLYAQSGDWIDRDAAHVRRNRIMERGPIELANVGVMQAKANSKDRLVRDDVWKAWTSMMRYLEEGGSARDSPVGERFVMTIDPEERSVLALAFEQVAKAARQEPESARGSKQGSQDSGRNASRLAGDDWDFSAVRQKPGMGGVGLGLRLGQTGVHGSSDVLDHRGIYADTPTKYLEFKGKHRMMIQQLLRHQEFLQPLLERRDTNVIHTEAPLRSHSSHPSIRVESRLEQLKSSFQWLQDHSIPVRIEGFNAYLEGLISHQDFKTARESLATFLAGSRKDPCSSSVASAGSSHKSSILTTIEPNLSTVKILSEYRGVLGGIKVVNKAIKKGGAELRQEWGLYMAQNPRKKRTTAASNSSASPPPPPTTTTTSSSAAAASSSSSSPSSPSSSPSSLSSPSSSSTPARAVAASATL